MNVIVSCPDKRQLQWHEMRGISDAGYCFAEQMGEDENDAVEDWTNG